MIYCFDKEDLGIDAPYNVFVIQEKYARQISRVCVLNSKVGELTDITGGRISDLRGEQVFLRASYDRMLYDIEILESLGARMLETKSDIESIENWPALGLTKRRIVRTTLDNLSDCISIFLGKETLFVKTMHKGTNMVVKRESLENHDSNEYRLLEEACPKYGEELLVSEKAEMKSDSMGKRESRHFFLGGELISSSRYVYGIRHKVPTSHIHKAKEIAQVMKNISFPKNFVLDVGDFIDSEGNSYTDIVEFNPLTCSECYVGNSIFSKRIEVIDEVYQQYRIGNEFCYDLLERPDKYSLEKVSNRSYQYT